GRPRIGAVLEVAVMYVLGVPGRYGGPSGDRVRPEGGLGPLGRLRRGLHHLLAGLVRRLLRRARRVRWHRGMRPAAVLEDPGGWDQHRRVSAARRERVAARDRKSTRLNSSHVSISYAVFLPPTSPPVPYTTLFRSGSDLSAAFGEDSTTYSLDSFAGSSGGLGGSGGTGVCDPLRFSKTPADGINTAVSVLHDVNVWPHEIGRAHV